MNNNLIKVLRGAVDALKTRGWTQNNYRANDGRVCAVGAIRVALGRYDGTPVVKVKNYDELLDLEISTQGLLSRVVREMSGGMHDNIISYNDSSTTTATKVREAFQRAIQLAKEEA